MSVVSIAILCFAGCTEKKSVDTFDTSILPEYSYELNEEKNGVGNIPFEEYLKEKTLPTDKTVVYVSQRGESENNDGISNANAINAVISELSSNGGGAVVIDGNYKTSTIELKSNISLYIKKDCTIMSLANCFKIGTETSKDVTNVIVENCDFFMAGGIVGGMSGIAIESADGSNVSDIKVNDIRMNGISSPILIWLGNRLSESNGSDGTMGSMQNIQISNIYCDNVELASAIVGVETRKETYYVKNVDIKNVYVRYRDTKENLDVAVPTLEDNMNGYPEITRVSHKYIISHEGSKYYDLPVYGLFLRHVDRLNLENFKVIPRTCSTLDKWNLWGELAVDSKNISVK